MTNIGNNPTESEAQPVQPGERTMRGPNSPTVGQVKGSFSRMYDYTKKILTGGLIVGGALAIIYGTKSCSNRQPTSYDVREKEVVSQDYSTRIPIVRLDNEFYEVKKIGANEEVVFQGKPVKSLSWYLENDDQVVLGKTSRFNGQKQYFTACLSDSTSVTTIKTNSTFRINQKGLEDRVMDSKDIEFNLNGLVGADGINYIRIKNNTIGDTKLYKIILMPKDESEVILDKASGKVLVKGFPYLSNPNATIRKKAPAVILPKATPTPIATQTPIATPTPKPEPTPNITESTN